MKFGSAKTNRREFLKSGTRRAVAASVGARLSGNILGANSRVRIGLIGCGNRGNYLIGQVLRNRDECNVDIVALCDVWKLNLDRTRDRVSTEQGTVPVLFSRYPDLLNHSDLDAVMIATPDFAHTPILIEAIKAGKDAYVEKPMATRIEHANQALDLAADSDRVIQVGTQRRSNPLYQKGAKLIQSGVLGKISEVEAAWHDSKPRWARDYSRIRSADVDWKQYLMFLPDEPFSARRFRCWHLFKDFTVGTPGLLGSHLIDVATWFMDDPLPRSAVAHGGIYVWRDGREHADTLDCIIEYPKGFIVNYSSRLGNNFPNTPGSDAPLPTTFYGKRGTFDTRSWKAVGLGGGNEALAEPIVIDSEVRHEEHVRNWLDCLRTRKKPSAPVEAGYAHSIASIMCFKAWTSGRRQLFDAHARKVVSG